MLPTSGFRRPPASGSSAQNAELLCASRWRGGGWSLSSGLSLEARLPGVVNVRGRRAPTDRSSRRREQLVRLAALGMGEQDRGAGRRPLYLAWQGEGEVADDLNTGLAPTRAWDARDLRCVPKTCEGIQ